MKNRCFHLKTVSVPVLGRFGILLLALWFAMLCLLPAAAKSNNDFPVQDVDVNKRGSLQITVEDERGDPVPTGTLQLYFVARVSETRTGKALVLTDEFSRWSGGTVASLSSDYNCAISLAMYVEKNDKPFTASAEIKNGKALFTNLEPGAYLVMQLERTPGYGAIQPFPAFLPFSSDDILYYNLRAHPKPTRVIPEGSAEITAFKEVIDPQGIAPTDTPFSFTLTALTPGAPLPKGGDGTVNPDKRSVTLTRKGPGYVDFGLISFTLEDLGSVFEYTIKEQKGIAAHYTYDSSTYKLTARVNASEDGISVSTVITDESGKEVRMVVFSNKYENEKETESQTPPGETTTKPGETTTKPGETTTRPGETTTKPGVTERTTVPGERRTTVPGENRTTSSRGGTTAPGEYKTRAGTDTYKTPDLPQTGQLWWPLFVMVPLGVLLLIVGGLHLRRGRKEEAEDAS